MKLFENKNWGLKLLAFGLAIAIYWFLKNDSAARTSAHDTHFFQHQR